MTSDGESTRVTLDWWFKGIFLLLGALISLVSTAGFFILKGLKDSDKTTQSEMRGVTETLSGLTESHANLEDSVIYIRERHERGITSAEAQVQALKLTVEGLRNNHQAAHDRAVRMQAELDRLNERLRKEIENRPP